MHDDAQVPEGAPLSEEIFRLNLSYLMLAQRLVAQDEQHAAIALGVQEPLTSWLRDASPSAVARLLPGRKTPDMPLRRSVVPKGPDGKLNVRVGKTGHYPGGKVEEFAKVPPGSADIDRIKRMFGSDKQLNER